MGQPRRLIFEALGLPQRLSIPLFKLLEPPRRLVVPFFKLLELSRCLAALFLMLLELSRRLAVLFFKRSILFYSAISFHRQFFVMGYDTKEQLLCLKNFWMQDVVAVNRPFVFGVTRRNARVARNLFFSAIFHHEKTPMKEYGVKEQKQGIKELRDQMAQVQGFYVLGRAGAQRQAESASDESGPKDKPTVRRASRGRGRTDGAPEEPELKDKPIGRRTSQGPRTG